MYVLAGSEDSTAYVDGVAEDTLHDVECLRGGFKDDVLIGDDQNNILIGGVGRDTLAGGGGANIFAYGSASDGGDTIQDFRADKGDKIAFFDFFWFRPGNQTLSFSGTSPTPYSVWYEAMENGEGIMIKVDTSGDGRTEEFSITLNGVTSLAESDLILG